MKIKVAVLFGGKSVEHEVSIISGIQAIMSMDTEKYDVIPVYITKKNEIKKYNGSVYANVRCDFEEDTKNYKYLGRVD